MTGELGCALRITTTPQGSVEAMPYIRSDTDAVVDIVKSGGTLRANNLTIIADGLGSVSLGAVWNFDQQQPTNISDGSFDSGRLQAALMTIARRVREAREGKLESYTQRLAADPNKLVKKMGEEAAELLGAVLTGSAADCESEAADNLYVMAIALSRRGTSLVKALGVLAERNTA